MPDLLLELFSEEIPARMQAKAADDLRRLVTDKLVAEGLVYEGVKAFATPRRLALTVHGIPARQPDLKDERKGPKVGAPDAAVQGFLKATGLASLDQAKIQRDPKKGDFYVALIEKPGRPAIDVLAEILPVIIRTFPWPKSMRWGARSAKPGALTWVRPLHSIVATFGIDTEDPEIVPFDISGITAGKMTRGHRFLAPQDFSVRRFEDYDAKLYAAKVVLDPQRRRDIIQADAKQLAFAQGFELVEDQVLLDEVGGLVEWPVVLMGSFDESFLSIPGEVIRATIRNNQKCFVVKRADEGALPPPLRGRVGEGGEPQDQSSSLPPPPTPPRKGEGSSAPVALAPKFILTANIEASDGGAAIIAGNERVIRARLSDAKFFYETDLKTPLEARLPKFENIVFHEKLGTQAARIARIERLAAEIAPLVGADVEKTQRAARLCKTDLLTEVVGEFPELQGLMGKYYALAQGEDASVAAACEEHYKPQGPNDRVPTDPISIAVALADKIDTLVGFWAIDEKPTGSKDPYALRRAAFGVIRLISENQVRLPITIFVKLAQTGLLSQFGERFNLFRDDGDKSEFYQVIATYVDMYRPFDDEARYLVLYGGSRNPREGDDEIFVIGGKPGDGFDAPTFIPTGNELANNLLSFFADRLKGQLREQGARHDLVDAVFAAGASALSPPLRGRVGEGGKSQSQDSTTPPPPTPPRKGEGSEAVPAAPAMQDDILLVVRRVEALGKFLDTDDGKNLLAGVKRASNILAIEEKKDKRKFDGAPDASLYKLPEEQALAAAIAAATRDAAAAVAQEDFAAAMTAMAKLRAPVDAFFDDVKVNDDDPAIRENRLRLLNEIRAATRTVADFSRIVD